MHTAIIKYPYHVKDFTFYLMHMNEKLRTFFITHLYKLSKLGVNYQFSIFFIN